MGSFFQLCEKVLYETLLGTHIFREAYGYAVMVVRHLTVRVAVLLIGIWRLGKDSSAVAVLAAN